VSPQGLQEAGGDPLRRRGFGLGLGPERVRLDRPVEAAVIRQEDLLYRRGEGLFGRPAEPARADLEQLGLVLLPA